MSIRTQPSQTNPIPSGTRVVWRKISEPRSWLCTRQRQVWTLSPSDR